MKMSNFAVYDPESKPYGEGVQYFSDDKGRDFYESRDLFSKKYVVFFDSFNIVRSVVKATEVTRVHPGGLSAVDLNALPKGFDLFSGIWEWDGKKVVPCDLDPSISTSRRKESAMHKLSREMVPLQDAVEEGEATKEEAEKYSTLRKLRIKLMRISDDTPPGDIDWSEFTTA